MKKKIKIMDILCMINCRQEVPYKIKYNNDEYTYDYEIQDYYDKNYNYLFEELFVGYDTSRVLETEVEILDEEDEFTDIVEWGEPALEEVKTKTDYTIKDLQRYIYILMQTQNDLTKNQKKIIERLKDE